MSEIINNITCHSRAYRTGSIRAGYKYWFECPYCGQGFATYKGSIRSGHTRSCGCMTQEWNRQSVLGISPANKMDDRTATIGKVYSSYKASARNKGHEFCLTKEDIERFIFSECFYCGEQPSHIRTIGQKPWNRPSLPTSGIDRYNNDEGYTKFNCVSCCRVCNYLKRDIDGDIFLDIINTIYCNHK